MVPAICIVEGCSQEMDDICEMCEFPVCEEHSYTAEQDGSTVRLCPECYAECRNPFGL